MSKKAQDVKLRNERELRFYRWFFQNDSAILSYQLKPTGSMLNINHLYTLDVRKASDVINSAIRVFYHPEIAQGYGESSRREISNNLLPQQEFSWFKKCQDACYYVWLRIRVTDIKNISHNPFIPLSGLATPLIPRENIYNLLDLISYPANHQERLQVITDFFDRLSVGLKDKLAFMKNIRSEWYALYMHKDTFPLKKNEKEKCEWAWKYIQRNRVNIREGAKKRINNKSNSNVNTAHDGENQEIYPQKYVSTLSELASAYQVNTLTSLHYYAMQSPTAEKLNPDRKDSSLYLHAGSLMPFLKPASDNEKRLIIRCLYICWFHTDDKFINRFQKAWEGINARKKSRERKR
ncbi:hypothetical protein PN823_000726 [Enterobacter hormaechei]|nr:hypothetical protein [Enterobacter hormaechei]